MKELTEQSYNVVRGSGFIHTRKALDSRMKELTEQGYNVVRGSDNITPQDEAACGILVHLIFILLAA